MTSPKDELDKIITDRVKKKLLENGKLVEKIDQEVEKDIDELIETEVKTVIEEKKNEPATAEEAAATETELPPAEDSTTAETEIPPTEDLTEAPKTLNVRLREAIGLFRRDFHLCWRGVCRPVSLIFLVGYAIIFILMFFCAATGPNAICLKRGLLGAGNYLLYVAILAFAISFALSIFSPQSKTALLFSLLLSIPLVILVLITTVKYIGLFLIGLVILNLIGQNLES